MLLNRLVSPSPGTCWQRHRDVSRLRHSCAAAPPASTTQSTDAQSDASTSNGGSVTIEYRGITITAVKGTLLRTALLQNGLTPHNGRAELINCRGLGTCGTCAVEVR